MSFILTAENYHSTEANKRFMSVSQYKDFIQCEAMALAKINGEYKQENTTALLVGSYVDAHFEGTLDIFKAKHPEIFLKSGDLKVDYINAEEIINRLENDELFMLFMSGEKQVIKTGEIDGVPFKIKIDSLFPNKIVDLKCMRSLEPIMGKSFIEHWSYDIQLAVYQEVFGGKLPVYIAAATKEPVTNLEIIHIPQWRLDECLGYLKQDLPHITKVKLGEIPAERCGICDYCKQTKVLTAPISFEDVGFSTKQIKMMRGEN
ncbi:MAG: PD-(D/E)XK nuclease-like domain-containing protein [Firmicutes bacterium]|nr:PD-(D/E)XK nuclease-like domain-containing protein [Bacillota bacterium]